MIKFKNITIRNFLSIGNRTQAVNLDREDLTLVLGKNLDLGGIDTGARNGVGKTAAVNALSYVLYGGALTNIKKDNLINKINGKQMLVTLEFEKDGVEYRIERGRRPAIIKLMANGDDLEEIDRAQGETRETQDHINDILGLSHTMFKHTVALNTYTEPFLSMRVSDQREVIEQLLGITLLSEKADKLKELNKTTKESIVAEEYSIKGIQAANENVSTTIRSLKIKQKAWLKNNESSIQEIGGAIAELENFDIDSELALHRRLSEQQQVLSDMSSLERAESKLTSNHISIEKRVQKLDKQLKTVNDNKCHTCGQELHEDGHEAIVADLENQRSSAIKDLKEIILELEECRESISELSHKIVTDEELPFYKSIEDAYNHNSSLEYLRKELTTAKEAEDPFDSQIVELTTSVLQEIDYTLLNDLNTLREHQEFLLKLLVNKDSFIRKKIIEQNLYFLNKRLNYYLEKIGLPHQVEFKNDLTVEIMEFGRDLDFDNLSRGERNRLILSLSWAFRDVWEHLYSSINVLVVDELIDSGIDTLGLEASVAVLKKMVRDRNKTIFLVSHRDELVGRVNNVLTVTKENGFTHFDEDSDIVGE
jgi:DNA repair exonuclease SbcCD ATPase subunit